MVGCKYCQIRKVRMRNRRRRRRKTKTVDFRSFDKQEMTKQQLIKEIVVWAVEIIFVILLAYFVTAYGVEKTTMVGSSMEGTLKNEDRLLINKMIYRFTSPKRFDIIVFKSAGKEHSYYTVRRVIGLPGETVQIIDGKVYINGTVLEEKINVEKISNGGLAKEPITLEENEYFVLGDNRNGSEDSRFGNVGNITRDSIIGKAWLRLNPFNFVHMLNTIDSETETVR